MLQSHFVIYSSWFHDEKTLSPYREVFIFDGAHQPSGLWVLAMRLFWFVNYTKKIEPRLSGWRRESRSMLTLVLAWISQQTLMFLTTTLLDVVWWCGLLHSLLVCRSWRERSAYYSHVHSACRRLANVLTNVILIYWLFLKLLNCYFTTPI